MEEAGDKMAARLRTLQASLEILGPKYAGESGILWDPATHIALGVWQVGRGKSSVFGMVTTTEPDIERIVAIVEGAMISTSAEGGRVTVLCGSYWDLSHVKSSLETAGCIEVLLETQDRLGGTRLALEGAGTKGLSKAIRSLWGECHSFFAYTGRATAQDPAPLLEKLDSEEFKLQIETGTPFALAKHSHPEDFLLFVEDTRSRPNLVEDLRDLVES